MRTYFSNKHTISLYINQMAIILSTLVEKI